MDVLKLEFFEDQIKTQKKTMRFSAVPLSKGKNNNVGPSLSIVVQLHYPKRECAVSRVAVQSLLSLSS